jgi:cytochrome c-type biogenesis protein CcmE
MMNPRIKFGLVTGVIVGVLGWLAVDGINADATYYVTVDELHAMENPNAERRLRVGGDVKEDSIVRKGDSVEFVITQEETELKVVYVGRDPLPDTFRNGAQALCTGRMRDDQVFEARQIQAKCASKYEAEPGKGASPVYETAPASNKAAF